MIIYLQLHEESWIRAKCEEESMITTKAVTSKEISDREQKNRRLAYEAAVEGIVLLENRGILPIEPAKSALFGAGAQYTIKGGQRGNVGIRRHRVAGTGVEYCEKSPVRKEL